ncbi:hypothetical protein FHX37_2836 [Haloactinospora alba]|uniref:Uncharacterized protein n=1 Tax=Haloactinospora alba TaxID=405555 RepID=A0A543NLY9_9ACTN|nr:hypothetical protein [Haloactinospora alba]TQN32851.1 hypothetical protein FHX37_2836 [Haloactinospora alba]
MPEERDIPDVSHMAPADQPFAAALLTALRDAEIPAEVQPPTHLRLDVHQDIAPMDLGDAFQHARATPRDDLPDFAAGVVRGMMRSFRSSGVRIGTHYPLPEDDAAARALTEAFAHQGAAVRFAEPDTVLVPLTGDRRLEADIGDFRRRAEEAPQERERLAAEFARERLAAGNRAERRTTDLDGVLDRLRVRVHPQSMLGPEARETVVSRELAPDVAETLAVDYPEHTQLLERDAVRGRDVSDADLFRLALQHSTEEPFEVTTRDPHGVPLIHLGGQHRYMASHVHVLGRYLDAESASQGALVALPLPELVLVHPLLTTEPVVATEVMQRIAAEMVQGDKPITSQVYWWRPRDYERLGQRQVLEPGHTPWLEPVRVGLDRESGSVTVTGGADFCELIRRNAG